MIRYLPILLLALAGCDPFYGNAGVSVGTGGTTGTISTGVNLGGNVKIGAGVQGDI